MSTQANAAVLRPGEDLGQRTSALKSLALQGTLWTVIAYGASQMIRLGSSVVLSRLLLPQYFGLMALLSTVIVGLSLFSDIGLHSSVIQNPRGDEPAFLNTTWTVQVLRGVALWILAAALAVPAAWFYHTPEIAVLLPVVALTTVIGGFNSTSLLTLARSISVAKLSVLELTVQACQLVVTVGWALIHASVWALVAGKLVSDGLRLYLSYRIVPGETNRFAWDREAAASLFRFGRWIFLSTAIYFLASQTDRLILGRLVPLSVLGVYGIAFSLSDIPRQVILMFCNRVAFPFVAKFSHLEREDFRRETLKYRFPVLLTAAALLAMVICTGDQAILRIYDSRYRDAAWMIPLFAVGLWHTILYSTTSPALLALGKSSYNAAGFGLSFLTLLVTLPLGYHWAGIAGAVLWFAFSDLPIYFVNLYGLWRERMLPVRQDLTATLFFLMLLAAGLGLRSWIGLPMVVAPAFR